MTQEDIDKIETLIGYLKYFDKDVLPKMRPSELAHVIKEAEEWINDLKKLL